MTYAEPLFGHAVGPWHRAFAFVPHYTFDGGWVWLRFVWRRRIQKNTWLDGGADEWWQFRRFGLPVGEPGGGRRG